MNANVNEKNFFDTEEGFRYALEDIAETRSMAAIHALIESMYSNMGDETKLKLLRKMMFPNDLDYIRMKCAEYLGREEEVSHLRRWLSEKSSFQAKATAYMRDYGEELN